MRISKKEISLLPVEMQKSIERQLCSATKQAKPKKRGMNKWEKSFAAHLDSIGAKWKFEAMRFRLAEGAWYKPDFMVWFPGSYVRNMSIVEVKGFWREAAKLRCKVFVEQYPMFPFYIAKRVNGQWITEEFKPNARG